MSNSLHLGQFGFGCVGQGLYGVLQETNGIRAEYKKIVVKNRDKQRPIDASNFGYTPADIIDREDVNAVVELIDTSEEAYEIVKSALKSGKSVVTANKKMVAEYYAELVDLQEETGQTLLYEASCAGSIPIIRNLEEYYDNDTLHGLEGIVNGTCTYILSKMLNEGVGYEPVLKEAQEKGFAESDPTLDVDGFDAKFKLVILTGHAFGVFLKPEQVLNVGIRGVRAQDLQFAREKGYKVQLVATAKRIGDQLVTFVLPQFVDDQHMLYNITKEYNGIIVQAAFAEKQFFVGKGAGGYPTASAVLSDISALTHGYKYEYKKKQQGLGIQFTTDVELPVYLRYAEDSDIEQRLGFTSIDSRFTSPNHNYLIGKVPLQNLLKNNAYLLENEVFVALMPNATEKMVVTSGASQSLAAV
ncbi:MAG: homoserine dehydrogenase [Bacteroidota bacterium]